MDRLLDYLTYRDRAGRRKLRRFTLAGIAIVGLVTFILGITSWNRISVAAVSQSTPESVAVAAPTSTARPPTATPSPECPQDPSNWKLAVYAQEQHLRRIQPVCVYEDLARTVAWYQALAYGYTGPEAAEKLAFKERPSAYDVKVPLNLTTGAFTTKSSYRAKRRASMRIPFTPLLPEYRQWWVTDTGQPAEIRRALIGCFRAADIRVDGSDVEVTPWHPEYPVMCWVRAVVTPAHLVQEFKNIRSHIPPSSEAGTVRLENELYGATTDGRWIYLGRDADFSRYVGSGEFAQTLSIFATRHNLPVWDTTWFNEAFGFEMRPLPDEWWSWADRSQEVITRVRQLVQERFAADSR